MRSAAANDGLRLRNHQAVVPEDLAVDADHPPVQLAQRPAEKHLEALGRRVAPAVPRAPRRHGGRASRHERGLGRVFDVSPIEMCEPAAFAHPSVPRDVFIFDDQRHWVYK